MYKNFKLFTVAPWDQLHTEFVVLADASALEVGNFYATVQSGFGTEIEAQQFADRLNNIQVTRKQLETILHLEMVEEGLTKEALHAHLNNPAVYSLIGDMAIEDVLIIANVEGDIAIQCMFKTFSSQEQTQAFGLDMPVIPSFTPPTFDNTTKEVVKAFAPAVIGSIIGLVTRKKMFDKGMIKSFWLPCMIRKPGTFSK